MIGKKLRVLVRLLDLVYSTAMMAGIVFFVREKWGLVYPLLVVLPLAITVCCVSRKYGGAGLTSWRAFFEIEEKK